MRIIAATVALASAAAASAQVYNLNADWSEAANPNGAWSLLEGTNPLPHVDSWQSSLGGWAQPQPGWAESENGNNRLPFFFKSNGSETFSRDFVAGDVVCHSWDGVNGSGNGQASAAWTSPGQGSVRVTGGVWLARNIGRAVNWALYVNGARRTGGPLFDGDAYDRANPFLFGAGDGGASGAKGIIVQPGDAVALRLETPGGSGEFVGIDLTVTFTAIACLGDANGDNAVTFSDLNIVLSNFGQSGVGLPGDVNLDDEVNFSDLNLVLSTFGTTCAAPAD